MIKDKNRYTDFIKIKTCASKDILKRIKRQSTEWEKIFSTDISEKGFESRIHFKNSYTDTKARQRHYKKITDQYPLQILIQKS